MTKRGLTFLIVGAVVVAFAAIVIASSVGSDNESNTHTMPGGQTMQGQMHTMENGQVMQGGSMGDGTTSTTGSNSTSSTHEMPNGGSMPGMDMGQ